MIDRNNASSGSQVIPLFRHYDDGHGRDRPPQRCSEFMVRITERLDGRVKGLTALFSALLLTIESMPRWVASFLAQPAADE